jgi:photosystem II stability/assembly factor-like uncharacterized protein
MGSGSHALGSPGRPVLRPLRKRLFAFVTLAVALVNIHVATAGTSLPRVTEYDALLVSTSDSSRILLGTQHGLFGTTDGGRTWTEAGLRGASVTSLAQIDHTILAGGRGFLASSGNGGKTWQRLHPSGLPNEQIDAIGSESSTVYVALAGAGLYRSTDLGRTFRSISLAVGPAIRALAVTSKQIIAGDVATGVYLSPNGQDWLHTARGMIMALAVGGSNREHVLAASWGIARSNDGGRRWRTTLHSHVMFGAVAWAPSDPALAYAVGDNRSFWRSSDGGSNWMRVSPN